jgi:hypothetical protein
LGQEEDYWLIKKGSTATEAPSIAKINRWPTTTTEASTQRFEYQTTWIFVSIRRGFQLPISGLLP